MGLADGKVNGQKAFMTGALKVKGNVMLAVSLSTVRAIRRGTS
jgi:putative sterol carrier protein